jgi:hypothetical protein
MGMFSSFEKQPCPSIGVNRTGQWIRDSFQIGSGINPTS